MEVSASSANSRTVLMVDCIGHSYSNFAAENGSALPEARIDPALSPLSGRVYYLARNRYNQLGGALASCFLQRPRGFFYAFRIARGTDVRSGVNHAHNFQ